MENEGSLHIIMNHTENEAEQVGQGSNFVKSSAEIHGLQLIQAITAAECISNAEIGVVNTLHITDCLQSSTNSLASIFDRPSTSSALRTRMHPWLFRTSFASDKEGRVELAKVLKAFRK